MLKPNKDWETEWLDGCVEQTLVSPSWNKIETTIISALPDKLEKDLKDPAYRQVMFELLGPSFVSKHFSNYDSNPDILKSMPIKKKEKLLQDMKSSLLKQVDTVIVETGLKDRKSKPQRELATFCKEANEVIEFQFQKHLKQIRSHKGKDKYTALDAIGHTLAHILSSDASLIGPLGLRYKEETIVIPHALRKIVWTEYLVKKEKSKLKNFGDFCKVKEKFQQVLAQNRKQNSYRIKKQINEEVSKVFQQIRFLKSLNTDQNVMKISKILEIFNNHSKGYQHHYIFWVTVMQQVYLENVKSDGGRLYCICTVVFICEKVAAKYTYLDKFLKLVIVTLSVLLVLHQRCKIWLTC